MYEGYFYRKLEKVGINNTKKKSVNQRHDKSFKDILVNKDEMSEFLKQFMGLEIERKNLEEHKNNFINNQFERRESDIIYKVKEKALYILIEHQSKIDNRMPIRILEYCMEIMKALDKSCNNPVIIPIVIYTGKQKWNVPTNFSDTQKIEDIYKKHKIILNYTVIDIRKYNKKQLIKMNTKMSSMMLIEKCKTREEIIDTIIKLRILTKDMEKIQWMKKIVEFVLADVLGDKKMKYYKLQKK